MSFALIFVEGIKKECRRLPSPFGWVYMVRMWVSLVAFRKGTCWQARFQENRRWRNDPSPPIVFRLFRFRKRRLIQPRISFSFCRLRPAESERRTEQQANQCGCCCHRSEDTWWSRHFLAYWCYYHCCLYCRCCRRRGACR